MFYGPCHQASGGKSYLLLRVNRRRISARIDCSANETKTESSSNYWYAPVGVMDIRTLSGQTKPHWSAKHCRPYSERPTSHQAVSTWGCTMSQEKDSLVCTWQMRPHCNESYGHLMRCDVMQKKPIVFQHINHTWVQVLQNTSMDWKRRYVLSRTTTLIYCTQVSRG